MERAALERMLEISRRMAETRHLSPLLDYAMREAMSLVNAEYGYLVLLRDDGTLDFRVKLDKLGNQLEDAEHQISTSILKEVVQTNRPRVIWDALADPAFADSSSVADLKLHSVMCVPLISRGVTIGAIYVENRSQVGVFREESLPPLIFFANQAAVSIENAILNDDLEERVAARTAELEQAMLQLEHSWMEAVEANRMRTEFLGNVVHDMRNPISASMTAMRTLRSGVLGELNEKQTNWVDKAVDATDHALALIRDMFDLAKIDMGQLGITLQDIDLPQFLSEIHEVGKALPWAEGVSFRLDLQPDLPSIAADPTRIRQVLLNMLTNALKFTEEGSVTLYAHCLEDQVLIGVRDTGIGVPAGKIDLLFERFQQFDDDVARSKSGAGLGLAICRELVEMHGGHIWAESERGEGADFKFTLPTI